VNTPGIYPLAVAVSGTNLFVVDLYQPLPICSTAAPCSGSIGVLPITVGTGNPASDTLGSPTPNGTLTYMPLCLTGYSLNATTNTWNCKGTETDVIVPTAVSAVTSGSFVYVSAFDSIASPNAGYVFGFAVAPPLPSGTTSPSPNGSCPTTSNTIVPGTLPPGTLCPLNNGAAPFPAGVHPSAIAIDSTSTYLYATDLAKANVLGFSIASGTLTAMTSGNGGSNAFPTGNQPSAIVADPTYPYVYVANSADSNVIAYSTSNGALTALGTYATGIQPVAIGIDPSTNHFLYTANYLDNGISGTVSGFELSPTAGTLINSQNSPYTSNAQPTAVAAIPHGGSQSSSSSQ
jgi:6-phosphogluconolactonase